MNLFTPLIFALLLDFPLTSVLALVRVIQTRVWWHRMLWFALAVGCGLSLWWLL